MGIKLINNRLANNILLMILSLWLGSCATFLTTTGTKGISFGMTKEQVLKRIETRYTIIRQDENTIVCNGMQEQMQQPALKTFAFEKNRLVSVPDKILDDRNITLNFLAN